MSEKKERSLFIDVAKGFGILMVMCGHLLSTEQGLRYFLYTIHIPLFLLLSGFFEKKQDNIGKYLVKIFKRLYLPYMLITAIDYVAYTFIYKADFWHDSLIKTFKAWGGCELVFDIPIWFLFALFLVKAFFQILHLIKNEKVKNVIICLIIIGGFFYMRFFSYIPYKNRYFAIFAVVPVLTYYSIGYLVKGLIGRPSKIYTGNVISEKILTAIIMVFALLITAGLSQVNGDVGVLGSHFGNIIFFIINSICGSFGFIILSAILTSSKKIKPRFISYFGKHSLAVQVTHYYLADYLSPYILEKLGKGDLRYYPPVQCIILISVILICLVILLVKDFVGNKIKGLRQSKT